MHQCSATTQEGSQGIKKKKCCARCAKNCETRNDTARSKLALNTIRPTCPVCPSCPTFPDGQCAGCPAKPTIAPPLVFVMPESPEMVWRWTDDGTSLSDSHVDEIMLPP